MRALLALVPLALVALLLPPPRPAAARPEFARRESKACGFCHINPRGGGPRNQTGLEYARNEFRFPARKGDLRDFERKRDREAMDAARRLIDIQHIPAATSALKRLEKSVKGDAAKSAVTAELHGLDVKGTEILGRARTLLRSNQFKERTEGLELLVRLSVEYKGLDVHEDVTKDLRELQRDKEQRERIRAEQVEAKAWLAYLDALKLRVEGAGSRATKAFEKILTAQEGTRAAKAAQRELKMSETEEGE